MEKSYYLRVEEFVRKNFKKDMTQDEVTLVYASFMYVCAYGCTYALFEGEFKVGEGVEFACREICSLPRNVEVIEGLYEREGLPSLIDRKLMFKRDLVELFADHWEEMMEL